MWVYALFYALHRAVDRHYRRGNGELKVRIRQGSLRLVSLPTSRRVVGVRRVSEVL